MTRRLYAGLLLGSVLALSGGCKKKAFEVSRTAYIVGPSNDIVSADDAEVAKVRPDAVAASVLLATELADQRVKFCSGTLVASDGVSEKPRVVTNHHCFAVTGPDGKAEVSLVPEACRNTTVWFGFRPGRTDEAASARCLSGSLRTDYDGDLAVFTIDGSIPVGAQSLSLWSGRDVGEGRKALIVHYPDIEARLVEPLGGGAKLPSMALTVADCSVLGEFDTSEWDLDRTLPFSLRHSCDLIHGSSGSGLVDLDTGLVLGVNWGGIKVSTESGQRVDNVATSAEYVAAFLQRDTAAVHAAATVRRRSSADAESGEDKKESSSGIGVAGRRCGVAGIEPIRDMRSGVSVALVLLPLLLTLVVSRRRPLTPLSALVALSVSAWSVPGLALGASIGTPVAAWGETFLLEAAFLAECAAVLGTGLQQENRLNGEDRALGARAAFARDAARRLGHPVSPLICAGESGDVAASAAAVGATFATGEQARSWSTMAALFASGPGMLQCTSQGDTDGRELLRSLHRLVQGVVAETFPHHVETFDENRLACALKAAAGHWDDAASASMAKAVAALLRGLRERGGPRASSVGLMGVEAAFLVRLERYPEALGLMAGLCELEPSLRLAYDAVQRAYSRTEKGQGAVALRGM